MIETGTRIYPSYKFWIDKSRKNEHKVLRFTFFRLPGATHSIENSYIEHSNKPPRFWTLKHPDWLESHIRQQMFGLPRLEKYRG